MKTTLLIPLLALACATSLRAQTVAGTQLEIGPSGSDQVYSTRLAGAIGRDNSVNSDGSLAVGQANYVYYYGLAVGSNNSCMSSGGAVFGSGNINEAGGALLVGSGNFAEESSDFSAFDCLLVGTANTMSDTAARGLIAGLNNVVSGGQGYEIQAASAIGRGLYNHYNNSTLIGQYNDSSVPQDSGLLFAIGNGVDSSHRSNAWEVYADGKIKMPRQGDILMGEFGNGD